MNWLDRLRTRPKRYRVQDFLLRERYRSDYALIARHLLESLDFESVFDVGCGNGFLLQPFITAGKRVGGIDRAPDVHRVLPPDLVDKVRIGDFTEGGAHWDLVCCVEVAEHIPPDRSVELVETLTGLAERWILFSAAPPGQEGRGHINCRPPEDWLAWMAERGWVTDERHGGALDSAMRGLQRAHWLRENCVLLRPVRRTNGHATPYDPVRRDS